MLRRKLMFWLKDHHLALFRVVFGVYFLIQFGRLLPWAQDLYGSQGALPDMALSPLAGHLPAWLSAWSLGDGPQWMLVALMALAACVALGLRYRLAAFLMWIGWALLWQRNVFTLNPSMPFNGFLMLAMAFFFPARPAWSLDRWLAQRRGRQEAPGDGGVPRDLWRVAWIVAAVAYSWSGLTKLVSPSWVEGEALGLILTGPLARPTPWVAALAALPWLTRALTWGTLLMETLYAPLALWRRGRPVAWLGMVGLHVGIVCTIQFAELSLGMLLIHLLTFDPQWLSRGFWRKGAHTRRGAQG